MDSTTATEQKTTVDELVEAMNARMLELELVVTGKPSSGYEDERFNGLVECYLQVRADVVEALDEPLDYIKQNYEWGQDTPFLQADQEHSTDNAVFWGEDNPESDKPVLTDYMIDPDKTDAMMAYISAPRFTVYTAEQRAANLEDIKAGL